MIFFKELVLTNLTNSEPWRHRWVSSSPFYQPCCRTESLWGPPVQQDTSPALKGNSTHTESFSVDRGSWQINPRRNCCTLVRAKGLCVCRSWPRGGSLVTHLCSLSCSSAACDQVDRYTHSFPECWCSRICSLHDLYCTHRCLAEVYKEMDN